MLDLLGHRIFVVDSGGDGIPVVLLHGFPTSSWDWVDVWPMLETRYRLVALDFLGFGLSDKPKGHRYSITEQADIVEAMLRSLSISDMHVLTHDYGVSVGQELLARQNAGTGHGRWRTVCFLNGGLFPETHRRRFIQSLLASPAGPWILPMMGKATFTRSMTGVFGPKTPPSPVHIDRMWALLTANEGRSAIPSLLSYMRDRIVHRSRWVGALQHTRIPIALINGPKDPVSGAHMVERFRTLVPGAHFIESLHDIGHYPHTEAPDSVVRAWLRFVDDVETHQAAATADIDADRADTVLLDLPPLPSS